jgi:hypothetical protein
MIWGSATWLFNLPFSLQLHFTRLRKRGNMIGCAFDRKLSMAIAKTHDCCLIHDSR